MRKRDGLTILIFFIALNISFGLRDDVMVKNNVFEVRYSEKLEQPLSLTYRSVNRPVKVSRNGLDFYTEATVHTSNNDDYRNNIWDKGHIAPAASFSDTKANLKQTFSYLNCALQEQSLNRTEWKYLEEQERVWDDKEPLSITVDVAFGAGSEKLPTGATVPSGFTKHIYFENTKVWRCYRFKNRKPTAKWQDSMIKCTTH
jgi:DNA/RNA endonuclease G (NUC1)